MSRGTQDPVQLLAQARSGNSQALGELLERYRSYLTLLARVQIGRRLQRKVDDSDLIQEAFQEAVRHFDQFRGTTEAELVSWLRQILAGSLANLVRRYLGTKQRDVRMEQELAADLDESSRALERGLVAQQSSPSEEAALREQGVLLTEALDRLPDDYREVIILSHLEGLKFPEVALRMGRTVHSVKNLWARALGKLRRSLGESHETE